MQINAKQTDLSYKSNWSFCRLTTKRREEKKKQRSHEKDENDCTMNDAENVIHRLQIRASYSYIFHIFFMQLWAQMSNGKQYFLWENSPSCCCCWALLCSAWSEKLATKRITHFDDKRMGFVVCFVEWIECIISLERNRAGKGKKKNGRRWTNREKKKKTKEKTAEIMLQQCDADINFYMRFTIIIFCYKVIALDSRHHGII